ncbi:hypothetical protein PFTANZ_04225 [Plasmodium falciparum Tanzania (2000708)]|uniref:Uncharacterized protein n=2 Tax=Plasmodium falciparum TaxID=5833 RepID=A0A024W2Y7_PLAFA|nr:hypothetical protein PFTANZ_04225 [Plasmodium falciparum Tanzania (2000708)]ETW41172.1 hypothetical protein PFNF135_04413 [Plasmodium falciparum NF135/5.C10]
MILLMLRFIKIFTIYMTFIGKYYIYCLIKNNIRKKYFRDMLYFIYMKLLIYIYIYFCCMHSEIYF